MPRLGWVRVVAVACAGCFVSPVIPLGSGAAPPTTPAGAEARAAHQLVPVELVVPDGDPPPTHVFRVRVWADAAFRQRPRWRPYVEDIVRRANLYLGPAFGVELEATIAPWERGGGATVDAILDELTASDPGDGADWVIAFVGPDRAVTSDYHRLGVAEILGKHFVLRDMNDADEAHAIERAFTRLDEKERALLYAARKRHKELLCFLHEWAHTLGHPHEQGDATVMAPAYSHRAALFSPAGARFLRLGVIARQNGPGAARAVKEMQAIVAGAGDEWPAGERAQVMAALGGGALAPSGSGPAPAGVSRAAEDMLRRAYDRAEAHDARGALVAVDAVRASLPPGSDGWGQALRLYLHIGALARFDELADAAPNAAGVADLRIEALRVRRETGLPPDAAASGVAAADEPDVRAAFVGAMTRLQDGDVAGARGLHATMQKRFPRALPTTLVACHLAGYARDAAGARKHCGAAAARWDDMPAAHFWLAQHAARPGERTAHGRRAVELDPASEGAWQALAREYAAEHDSAALEALRRDFQLRFHRTLR